MSYVSLLWDFFCGYSATVYVFVGRTHACTPTLKVHKIKMVKVMKTKVSVSFDPQRDFEADDADALVAHCNFVLVSVYELYVLMR